MQVIVEGSDLLEGKKMSYDFTRKLLQITGMSLTLLHTACSNTNFSEKSGASSASSDNSSEPREADATLEGSNGLENSSIIENANNPSNDGQNSCIEGDVISLRLPPDVQSCMNQGRVYSFSSGECLEARKASFDCQFDAMAEQVAGIGVRNQTIWDAKAAGALLVSCGEKDAGNTIIAQWYYPAQEYDKCSDLNPIPKIVTACYKQYGQSDLPILNTKEDYDRVLLECLRN